MIGRRWYLARVFLLLAGAIILTWYARQGRNNPFAVDRSIRVYGGAGGGGYAVAAVAAGFRKEAASVGEVAVSGGAVGAPPPASKGAAWREAYPFSDSVRAVLLVYGGMTALICDSSVYAPLRGGAAAVAPKFREKLDILALPPSAEGDVVAARNGFRPRAVAVAAPCAAAEPRPALQNILCAPVDSSGRFSRSFSLRNGKLVF